MRRSFFIVALIAAVSLLVLACGSTEDPEPAAAIVPTAAPTSVPTAMPEPTPVPTQPPADTPTPEPTQPAASLLPSGSGPDRRAPELAGLDGWLNSEPFTLEDKRGQIVLIDFWTYTCVNCVRTLPYIKEWHDKYADKGLVILGVHAPEFEFEKIPENVAMARDDHGLEYPIAQDNDMQTWRAFENQYWPAKYLIDKDGAIRYTHFGEGAYVETEEQIRDLLSEAGADLTSVAISTEPEREVDMRAFTGEDPFARQTRELYAGFIRNFGALRGGTPPYVMHEDFYGAPSQDLMYEDPGDHRNHHMYLQGLWHNGLEELVHARETEAYEDYLALTFMAIEVNVVLSEGDEPYDVRVTIDGRPLEETEAGSDITFDEEGNSFVTVDASDIYHLVQLPEYSGHELQLSSNSDQMAVFAFTFGSYLETEDASGG